MLLNIQKQIVRFLASLPSFVVGWLGGSPHIVDGQVLDPRFNMLNKLFPSRDKVPYDIQALRRDTDQRGGWLCLDSFDGIYVEDVDLEEGTRSVPVRIYFGASGVDTSTSGCPTVLYFHGGGHIAGSIESHDQVCRRLACRASCKVISVGYRLAPENKFPAGIEDAFFVFDYLYQHATKYGVDKHRIALMGDSAGANVAAVVAQRCARTDRNPCFQVLVAPWLDMTYQKQRRSYTSFGKGYVLELEGLKWFSEEYLAGGDSADPLVSPILGDVSGVASTAVLVAEFDPLRDEGLEYADKLRASGVDVDLYFYGGLPHAFLNMAGYLEEAD